jgi:hypothetical protein
LFSGFSVGSRRSYSNSIYSFYDYIGDNKTTIDVEWDIKMTGFLKIFTGMVKEHISIGMHGVVKGYRKQLNNYLPEILIPLF